MNGLQTPTINPEHSINWRKRENGCKLYRERWFAPNRTKQGELIYQVFCGQDTPPTTLDEQHKCMCSARTCWRTGGSPVSVTQRNAEQVKATAS